MSEKGPMTQVYEKAAAEQERYKEWLYSLPAKEALEHAFEYTAREDILMELEGLELEPRPRPGRFSRPTGRWRIFTMIFAIWKAAAWTRSGAA